ncbi:hypothetical protein LUZ63_005457 [Rhynchospora breviuscula]|uniref:AP2/ERF domain-containing protein n=1 Tax=Rhynchospora breviuscula TaxID=2022672 RepID=A0A9Q0HT23_9POAL|nr:hypothetical protein LUZ63_005457 [Rhynchospora breviuscula]
MVSIRRRRNLALYAVSGKSAFQIDLPKLNEIGKSPEKQNQSENQNHSPTSNHKPFCVHPLPSISFNRQPLIECSEDKPGPSSITAPSSPKKEPDQTSQYYPEFCYTKGISFRHHTGPIGNFPSKEIKRRKRHRRKQYDDQEPCTMRGVYFKNMKWQAAIKVDKKQIHLGTVESQEEAARLYDRAAFMCGREPNYELSEEDKDELRKYTWEAFLEMTRNNINNKKQRRKFGGARRKRMEIDAQSEGGSSQSDGTDPDALAS